MTKVVLFTGAGANHSLGLPTTTALFGKIENNECQIRERQLFTNLYQYPDVQDIEHVWSYLEELEKIGKNEKQHTFLLKQAQFSLTNWRNTLDIDKILEQIKSLRIDLENILFDEYAFSDDLIEEALTLYQPILSFMQQMNDVNGVNLLPIFTTNYDRVIDEIASSFVERTIAENSPFKYVDGFPHPPSRTTKLPIWNPDLYNNMTSGRIIASYQLHGSLCWRENSNTKKIEKKHTEALDRPSRRHSNSFILYPGTLKDGISAEPYKTLHDHLRNALLNAEKCIVVGFSFRDKHILDIFQEGLKKNKRLKIVLITPEPDLPHSALTASLPKKQRDRRILAIPRGFEDIREEMKALKRF
ncbi:MAG: SIR2 family protein [Thermoplasmata archaeon]|nr:SIR2 family protein [Thermoplasmata archaeon]